MNETKNDVPAGSLPKTNIHLNICCTMTHEEFIADVDLVLDMVEAGYSPVLIKSKGHHDMLLFGWDDYMERFGSLYSKEELDQIYECCKNYTERNDV